MILIVLYKEGKLAKITDVFFDWNGTIIPDTKPSVMADNLCLELLGVSPKTVKIYRKTFIFPVSAYYEYHGADPREIERLKDEICRVFTERYEQMIVRCRTRKGTRELLEFLKKRRINSLILSNHYYSGIVKHLERLKLSKYFSVILSNPDVVSTIGKSKDQRLEDYLISNKLNPSKVIIIGDSCEEIELAKQFGLFSIAITDGYVSTQRLRQAKPNEVVSHLGQVIDIIKNF